MPVITIRRYFVSSITSCGHATQIATTAGEALALVEGDPGGIDVLLTDYTLPDKKGTVLAAEIRERYPAISIAYVSGFRRQDAGVGADELWLQKPFELDALAETLVKAWKTNGSR